MSYPEVSGFSEYRAFQLSPRAPAASHCGRISLALQNRFHCCHMAPVRDFHSLSFMSGPNPLARSSVSSSPSTSAACRRTERVERSVAAPSSRSDVASPIRGTTLRRKLGPRWRREPYRSGGPTCPFGRVYSAAWRAAQWGLSNQQTPRCRPPSMHARTRICARSSPVLQDI